MKKRGSFVLSIQDQTAKSDKLTVVVFKDHHPARSFTVPLNWISRMGLILGFGGGMILLSLFFAFKYYRISLQANPAHIAELENQLNALKTAYQETVTQKNQPSPEATPSYPHVFTLLPSTTQLLLEKEESPVNMEQVQLQWIKSTLKVQFNLQYVKKDGGSQQGHVILLARGSDRLFAYPQGIFNTIESGSLIEPKKGEYFSVSRFRAVQAQFVTLQGEGVIDNIDVLIFNQDGNLLFMSNVKVKDYLINSH